MFPEQTDRSQDQTSGAARLKPLVAYSGSLGQKVYFSLKDAILSLAYQPGEILRKGDICDALGVSRSPVSEAMARLAADGLVEVVPQAGTFVLRFSIDEIREGAFLREALELAAIELVAEIITEAEIVQLRRNLRVQEALVADADFEGFYKLDSEMHEMLMSFTGHRRLAQIAQTAWLHVDRARQLILPAPGRVEATLVEHRAIVDAVAAHDAALARQVTRHHLRQLMSYLEPLEREHPELFSPS